MSAVDTSPIESKYEKLIRKKNIKVGDKVEATLGKSWSNTYYPGVIRDINQSKGTCAIDFEDGESLDTIKIIHVKGLPKQLKAHKPNVNKSSRLEGNVKMPPNLATLKIKKEKAAMKLKILLLLRIYH